MIVFKNVTKKYGGREVLSAVSFRIEPRQFVCVTGPSGAGKSTIIRLLIGAESTTSGAVEVDGANLRSVPPAAMQLYRRRVGVMFQDDKLLENRTVWENIAYPLEVCGTSTALIRKRVPLILKRMDLTARAHALPRELSGGERARTALARAIVHHPAILLADEPTGNVDPKQSMAVLELLRDINRSGTTVILATHDTVLVDILHTRVIRLDSGKVIRDSIGGYEEGKREYKEKEREQVAVSASKLRRTTPIMEPFAAESKDRRKIHITAIGAA